MRIRGRPRSSSAPARLAVVQQRPIPNASCSRHPRSLAGRRPRKLALPRHARELLLLASNLILTLTILRHRQATHDFEHLLGAAVRRQIKPDKVAHTEMIAHPVPPGLMPSARNAHPGARDRPMLETACYHEHAFPGRSHTRAQAHKGATSPFSRRIERVSDSALVSARRNGPGPSKGSEDRLSAYQGFY